jgi:hypothetical protein
MSDWLRSTVPHFIHAGQARRPSLLAFAGAPANLASVSLTGIFCIVLGFCFISRTISSLYERTTWTLI